MNKTQFVERFPTFSIGQLVTKTKGSQWTGHVVGFYSTTLTPEGYAVESETEKGSVQIYPVSALKAVFESKGVKHPTITKDHIYVLFETLQSYLPVMSLLDKQDTNSLPGVFCAKFIPGNDIKVEIEGHYVDYNSPSDIFNDKIVNVSGDWINSNLLWFRIRNNTFEAFVDYIDEYRDTFTLINKDKAPVLSFAITL